MTGSMRVVDLLPKVWMRNIFHFHDAPEYVARTQQTPFSPPSVSIKELHAAVPRHLFERSTSKSLFYVSRHLLITYVLYCGALRIDAAVSWLCGSARVGPAGLIRFVLWCVYWFWQSVSFTGIWTLGED